MLNKSDIEYLVNAMDTHLRQTGLRSAQQSVLVAAKLQQLAKDAPDAPVPTGMMAPKANSADPPADPPPA